MSIRDFEYRLGQDDMPGGGLNCDPIRVVNPIMLQMNRVCDAPQFMN